MTNPVEECVSDLFAFKLLGTGDYHLILRSVRLPKQYRGTELDIVAVNLDTYEADCFETKFAHKPKKIARYQRQLQRRINFHLFRHVYAVYELEERPIPEVGTYLIEHSEQGVQTRLLHLPEDLPYRNDWNFWKIIHGFERKIKQPTLFIPTPDTRKFIPFGNPEELACAAK